MRKNRCGSKRRAACQSLPRHLLILTLAFLLVLNCGVSFAEQIEPGKIAAGEKILPDTTEDAAGLGSGAAVDPSVAEANADTAENEMTVAPGQGTELETEETSPAEDDEMQTVIEEEIQGEDRGVEDGEEIAPISCGYAAVYDGTEVFESPEQTCAQGRFTGRAVVYFEKLSDTEVWVKVTFDTKDSLLRATPVIGYVSASGMLFPASESIQLQQEVSQDKEARCFSGVMVPVVRSYAVYESEEDLAEWVDPAGGEVILEAEKQADIPATATETPMTEALPACDAQLRIERNGLSSLQLSWTGSEDAVSYELYRMIDDGAWKKVKNVTGSSTANLNLEPGHVYAYRIRERFADGTYSEFSAASTYLFENVLDAPQNVTVRKQGKSSVTLRWDAVEGAEKYVVYRSVNGGAWLQLKTVDTTSTINYSLSANSQYAYKLYAISSLNGGAYSDYSNSVKFSLVTEIEPPMISAVPYGMNTVVLKWNAVENAVKYNIYRSVDGAAWKFIKSSTDTKVYNYSLKENNSYAYRINVVYEVNGETKTSRFSNVVDFRLGGDIGKPEDVCVARVSGTCAEISWTLPGNADGYTLYRRIDGGSWKKLKDVPGAPARNYALTLGTMYSYYLRGYIDGEFGRYYGPSSEEVNYWNAGSVVIRQDAPEGEKRICWGPLTNADYYRVYLDDALYATTTETTFDFTGDDSGEVTVTACREFEQKVFEARESNAVRIEKEAQIHYRALLIGETTYAQKLNGPDNDVAAMANTLVGLQMGYDVFSQLDASKEEIIDLIDIAFSGATEDDMSLFYYSGHGVIGSGEYYSGAIQTVDYQYITTQDLAELLSAVPGKVIVIMDSCGSGATISNEEISPSATFSANGQADTEIIEFDAERFSQGVINAFSPYYLVSDGAGDEEMSGRAMELRTSKFYVLTGSAYEEPSLTVNPGDGWGGLLTRGIASCAGFTYPTSSFAGSFPGDSNQDGKITLAECGAYCAAYAGNVQHVLSYPGGSKFTMFFLGGGN